MAKPALIKTYVNDTDFSICIWNCGGLYYKITVYDYVTRKHEAQKGTFATLEEAKKKAKKLNKQYNIQ